VGVIRRGKKKKRVSAYHEEKAQEREGNGIKEEREAGRSGRSEWRGRD